MPAVFIVPASATQISPGARGRQLDLMGNLYFYFIVRKRKWMNVSVKESKCGSDQAKGAGIVLNWDRPHTFGATQKRKQKERGLGRALP
jgi:hypothetical protein